MISINVNSSTYIYLDVGNNDKDSKFKVVDHERISKYRNIVAKSYTANFPEEVFGVTKVEKTVQETYVIKDLKRWKYFWNLLKEKDHKRQCNDNLELKS